MSTWVRQAIERHVNDLKRAALENAPIYFSERHAKHALGWIAKNAVATEDGIGVKVGDRVQLQAWQQAAIWILFGWRRSDGTRRFRTVYAELARGQGKSFLASIIALYVLKGEGVKGSAVYSIATTMEQAKVVFDTAALVVEMNKTGDLCNLTRNKNLLYTPGTATFFRPLASNEHNLDGLKPNLIVVDELHAHRSRGPWNKCRTALGKKPGSMMIAITTAGFDRHSVCYEQREYAEKILSGVFEDDSYFALIYALSKDDDPFDPKNWKKANPNLGVSIELQTIEDAAKQAQAIPTEYQDFLRLRCNIWTESSVRWMPMSRWDACNGALDLEYLKGRPCFGGLDLSTVTDLSAFVLVFPPYDGDETWYVLPFFYMPKDNIQDRVKNDRVPYDAWSRAGLFVMTEGQVTDFDHVREHVVQMSDLFDVKAIAYDPWNAHQLVAQLEREGMTMVKTRQGFISMNSPTKALMEKTVTGVLAHGGNPVLRWMMSNTVVSRDPAGNIKPDKEKSTEKIDGVVATINALSLATVMPVTKKKRFVPFTM